MIAPLPHLSDCDRLDFRQWHEERLVGFVDEHWRHRLKQKLSPTYDQKDPFKMLPFKNDISRISDG